MDLTTAVWYGLGLVFLLLLLQVLARPIGVLIRLLGSSLIAGLVLWSVNLAGGLVGVHIGLNPVSALTVGVLGIPGLLGLGLLRLILG